MIGLLVLLAALYGLRAWFYWAKRRDVERTDWHPYEVTDACRWRVANLTAYQAQRAGGRQA